MKSIKGLISEKKEMDDIQKKFNEFCQKEGLYVVKEQKARTINSTIELDKIYNIGHDVILGQKYKIEWYKKDEKNSNYFEMQLFDDEHVYVLLGTLCRGIVTWQGDKYNRDRLVIMSGLYTNNEEYPKVLRDLSEDILIELEYLIKKELLPLL